MAMWWIDHKIIELGKQELWEMVQVNNYENQTDDSKDGEWVADINQDLDSKVNRSQ